MINPYDFYITDEEYTIAEKNGISKHTLNYRIRMMGWDKEKALTIPPRKYNKRKEQIEIAESNGIGRTTFYDRLAYGWKVEDAYTIPVMERCQILERMWKERDRKRGKKTMSELINGNAIEFMKTLEDESIDLIITDPPYKVTAKGCAGNSGGMMVTKLTMQGKIFVHNDLKPIDYIPEFYRLLKDGSHCYIMTNHVNLQEMLNTATECGFHFIKSLIWNKGNKIMGRFYMSQFEYILFFRKGKGKKINKCGTSDILSVPNKKTKDKDGKNIHDTEKPVELMKILIENSSQECELVLDPFMGVGATGIACKELNRNFIGIELDEKYYNIAQSRIKGYVCE